MLLSNVTLSPADQLLRREAIQNYQAMVGTGQIVDGKVRHAVNNLEGTFDTMTTVGQEEYVNFTVFLGKIRRDNEGLADQPRAQQVAWAELAKKFIDDFGSRTPPDISTEYEAVKEHLGI